MRALARRNLLEMLRDPLTLAFGAAAELTALAGAANFEEAFLRLAMEGGDMR